MEALYNLAVMVSVLDKFTGPVQKMAQTLSQFEKNIQAAKGMIDFGNRMAVSGTMLQGAAEKMIRSLAGIMTPTVEVQRSLGELASVGIKNLDAVANAATSFVRDWSGVTKAQFISAAYDIKSGISALSDEGVGALTRYAALTARATKSTVAEMTSLFATGYGIYKDFYSQLSDFDFGQMFSAGIAAAVQQFKTTGAGMAQALTTLGAAATSARRPFEEQLAVLGMLQATMPGGEAATKYRAFLQSAAKAGQDLGLSFVDSNNQLLSMVDILSRLRGKYGETLDAIEKQQIQKAFGTVEAVALIELLYDKVGLLRGNVEQMGMAMRQGIRFTEEMARTMNTGIGPGLEILINNVNLLKEAIGNELAPLIEAFIPTIKGWVNSFQGLAKSHPTLVRTGLLVATVGAATVAVLAPIVTVVSGIIMMAGHVVWAWGQVGKAIMWIWGIMRKGFDIVGSVFTLLRSAALRAVPAIARLASQFIILAQRAAFTAAGAIYLTARHVAAFARTALTAAVTALPPLIASVWSFTAALLANPITWVVLAIAGLGAAIYALWRNWDRVTAFLTRTWEQLKSMFAGAGEWFAGVFQNIVALAQQYGPVILAALMPVVGIPLLIAQHWGTIKDTAGRIFGELAAYIPAKITEIVGAIGAKAVEFLASGRALIESFTAGIQAVINRPVEVVREGLAKLRRLLPFSDAQEGPLSTLTRSGMAFVETFAGGILSRSGLLKTAAAAALAGAALTAPLQASAAMLPALTAQAWINPVLGAIPQLPELTARARITPFLEAMPGAEIKHEILREVPRVSLREFVRESIRERETTRETKSTRQPVVIVVKSEQAAGGNVDDLIDLAYRYLSMHGD
ncbi:MAG: phage tail tape measure protein [Bacillota bacterium]